MIKLVIWIDLSAQSVCMYQLWYFLILWYSWLEDSIDYKFIMFGYLEQKLWIKQANRCVWFKLKIDSIWILKLCVIMVLLDSTHSKVSNDILFVIFGPMNQKIWIIQYWTEFRFEILFYICFESEQATCRFLISRYQFRRIRVLVR
jgi:hypothetical protein